MPLKFSRRKFLRAALTTVGGFGIAGIGGTAYITNVEPGFLDITRIDVPLPNLLKALDGLTIVQVSDWHLGEWMTLDKMLGIAKQTNDLNPDVIVFTGDFMSYVQPTTISDITHSVQAFKAREAVLAILGNHDHWTNAQAVIEAVQKAGNTQMLLNANAKIQRGDAVLYIAGVDDIWEKKHDLNKALVDIPDNAAVILLAHEPDYADEVGATKRIGLQLSGHSHGGQFRVPFKGAIALPYLGQKYDMGMYNINGMTLYVNRGVGMISPYVRFNCRPEITHYTLRVPA